MTQQRECNNSECGWKGTTERMLGSVGPLCPKCGETTEPAVMSAAPSDALPEDLTAEDIRAIRNSFPVGAGYVTNIIRKAFEWGKETARERAALSQTMQPQAEPAAGEQAGAVARSEHYDEVKATLQGAHRIMETVSSLERRVGPVGSHARGYTHKITKALRHLDALAAPGAAITAREQECATCVGTGTVTDKGFGSLATFKDCPDCTASREEAPVTPSEKQQRLLDLADRIDHEQLWRRPFFDREKMTPDQQDRLIAAVELRRYARLWKPGYWVIFPPEGPVSYSASTLDKAAEMAGRHTSTPEVIDAAQEALDAYESRFESTKRTSHYDGPIDPEMKALRAALKKAQP